MTAPERRPGGERLSRYRTLVVLAAIAGLLAFAVWWDKKSGGVDDGDSSGVEIFPWDSASVTSIEIRRGTEVLRVEKREGVWWVAKPREILANADAVASMLNAVHPLNKADRLSKSVPAPGPDVHGLGAPVLEAILGGLDGKSARIRFGKTTGSDKGERVYLRSGDAEDILVGDAYTLRQLDVTFPRLRDLGVARFLSADLVSLKATSAGKSWTLARKGGGWALAGTVEDLADPGLVEDWVGRAAGVEGLQWESRGNVDYGFEDPFFAMELTLRTRSVRIAVGKPTTTEGRRWLESSEYPGEVSSVRESEVAFLVPDAEVLRARRAIPAQLQDAVAFEMTGARELSVRKTGDSWEVLKPVALPRVFEGRIQELFMLLATVALTDRVPPVDPPAEAISLTWRWPGGEAFTAHVWADGDGMFVRTNDPPRQVRVPGQREWVRVQAGPGAIQNPDLFPDRVPLQTRQIIVEKDGREEFSASFDGRSWTLDRDVSGRQLDQDRMKAFNQHFSTPVLEAWILRPKTDPEVGLGSAPRWRVTIVPDPARGGGEPRTILVGADGPNFTLYGVVDGTEDVFLLNPNTAGALRSGVWKQ